MAGESFLRGIQTQRELTPPDLAGMAAQKIGSGLGGLLTNKLLEELDRGRKEDEIRMTFRKQGWIPFNEGKKAGLPDTIFTISPEGLPKGEAWIPLPIIEEREKRNSAMKLQEAQMQKLQQEVAEAKQKGRLQFTGFNQAGVPQVQEGVPPGFEGPAQAPRNPFLSEAPDLKPFMEARESAQRQAAIQGRFEARQEAKPIPESPEEKSASSRMKSLLKNRDTFLTKINDPMTTDVNAAQTNARRVDNELLDLARKFPRHAALLPSALASQLQPAEALTDQQQVQQAQVTPPPFAAAPEGRTVQNKQGVMFKAVGGAWQRVK